MTTIMKYNLKQVNEIAQTGFQFKIPDNTCDIINYLCTQVGSSGISSDVFISQSININNNSGLNSNSNIINFGVNKNNKKKKGNRVTELSSEEWESIRTFQTTKIEQKTGIDKEIDLVRLYLNKLTDKTYLDLREKIIEKINSICEQTLDTEDINKLGQMLYEVSSSNKFYSKIFADVFAELATMYEWLKTIFDEKYACIMDKYNDIEYIDADKNYDGFCEMNKKNEKRRAVTAFYINLAINGFIHKNGIINILRDILTTIMNMINIPDKKNDVDELTEIIAILFNKDIIEVIDNSQEEFYVLDNPIIEVIHNLAQQKAKDYPSLSNKAIFKYMDLDEL